MTDSEAKELLGQIQWVDLQEMNYEEFTDFCKDGVRNLMVLLCQQSLRVSEPITTRKVGLQASTPKGLFRVTVELLEEW